ncbi:hypothetical protein AVEN_39716-1 [Araneus ventricosus]|uniref:Uncharacterized protein n=1 Tax=Araneus ventricosus TaxID=182803 RepID=A0A4Y2LVE1_ARAVE|nr:hypothetical protein AVEN_39716-1 [Araneus ventricosus]
MYCLVNSVQTLWAELKENGETEDYEKSENVEHFWVKWMREGTRVTWTEATREYIDPDWIRFPMRSTPRFSDLFSELKPRDRSFRTKDNRPPERNDNFWKSFGDQIQRELKHLLKPFRVPDKNFFTNSFHNWTFKSSRKIRRDSPRGRRGVTQEHPRDPNDEVHTSNSSHEMTNGINSTFNTTNEMTMEEISPEDVLRAVFPDEYM